MTSSDADFPAMPGYDVPQSSSTLNDELLSKERSYVNPCTSQRREHRSEKDTTSAFLYLWSNHRHTQETLFQLR